MRTVSIVLACMLLRIWKQEAWLTQVNDDWAKDSERRDKKIAGIKKLIATEEENALPQWYVNGQGQTMVVIPGPVEFMMGSPANELGRYDSEVQHKRRIGRTFAIATKSVTVEQYRQFDKGYSLPAENTRLPHRSVVEIDWYTAARYANWLSEQEGLPADQWCYEITVNQIRLKATYVSLSGYRLPTEAEIEYSIRAGVLTSRFFGDSDELLPKYGWYNKYSQDMTWPVGSLKPNDLGLFDVLGNVFTWCQESFKSYPVGFETTEDIEDSVEIGSTADRALRGGSYINVALSLRSAARTPLPTNFRYGTIGFRLARTFPVTSSLPTP